MRRVCAQLLVLLGKKQRWSSLINGKSPVGRPKDHHAQINNPLPPPPKHRGPLPLPWIRSGRRSFIAGKKTKRKRRAATMARQQQRKKVENTPSHLHAPLNILHWLMRFIVWNALGVSFSADLWNSFIFKSLRFTVSCCFDAFFVHFAFFFLYHHLVIGSGVYLVRMEGIKWSSVILTMAVLWSVGSARVARPDFWSQFPDMWRDVVPGNTGQQSADVSRRVSGQQSLRHGENDRPIAFSIPLLSSPLNDTDDHKNVVPTVLDWCSSKNINAGDHKNVVSTVLDSFLSKNVNVGDHKNVVPTVLDSFLSKNINADDHYSCNWGTFFPATLKNRFEDWRNAQQSAELTSTSGASSIHDFVRDLFSGGAASGGGAGLEREVGSS